MTSRFDWPTAVSSCWKSSFSPEICRAYAEGGVTNMELSGSSLSRFTEEWDFVRNARRMAETAASYGVRITSVHLPFGPFETMDPSDPDASLRRVMIAAQSELIRAAGSCGIPIAVIHPSGEPYRPEERRERLCRAAETLAVLAGTANAAGVRLAVENLPRTCLCSVKEEYAQLLREVPELWACFDTNHSLQQPNPDFIRAAGGRIITLHVSDYDFVDERHLLPGQGKNDWGAILQALEETDYAGFFTYEVGSKGRITMDEFPRNHRWLNTI